MPLSLANVLRLNNDREMANSFSGFTWRPILAEFGPSS